MEAYQVWVTLGLKGDALKKMEQFTVLTRKANIEVTKLTRSTKSFNSVLDTIASALKIVNPELAKFSVSFIRLNTNTTGARNSLSRFNSIAGASATQLNRAATSASQLARSLHAVESRGIRASASLGGIKAGGMSGIGGGKGGSSGMGHFASGLGLVNPYFMAGAATIGLGVSGFKANESYQATLMRIKGEGFGVADLSRANQFAMNNPLAGISQKSMLTAVMDAAMATGNMGMALKLAPTLAQINFGNKAAFGKGFSQIEENNLIRFAEMRGGSDPKSIQRAMNLGEQAYFSTSGRMTPRQLLNMQQMATTAGYKLSDSALLELAPIMQEMGGFRFGTGLQQGFNRLIAGVGLLRNKKVVAEGERIGLLNKKGVMPDSFAEAYMKNPFEFWTNILKPIYQKAGITSDLAVSRENQFLLGTTPARFFDNMRKNEDKAIRMLPLHKNAFGAQDAYLQGLSMPSGKMLAFHEAFNNFAQAIGALTAPAILSGITTLTTFFNNLSGFINKNMGALGNATNTGGSSLIDIIPGVRDAKLFYQRAVGSKSDLTAGSHKQSSITVNSNLHIDGQQVARSTANHLGTATLSNQFVQHGTSSVNTTSSPIAPGLPLLGGFG